MSIDWSKAPEGATHFDPVDQNWLMQFLNVSFGWLDSEGWTTKGWQYPNDLSTMPRLVARPAWSGEGLPPIGTICICTYLGTNQEVRILGVDGKDIWCHGQNGKYTFMNAQHDSFSPMRPPEQIAAEKRIADIDEIIQRFGLSSLDAENIYDAGYRKEVKS